MKLNFSEKNGLVVKFVVKNSTSSENLKQLEENGYFHFKNGECFIDLNNEPTLIVGLGAESEINNDTLKVAGLKAGLKANELKKDTIYLEAKTLSNVDNKELYLALIEGVLNSSYNFDKYKKEKFKYYIENINIPIDVKNEITEDDLDELLKKWEGIVFARNLVNTPANDLYPKTLANEALKLKDLGVNVKVFNKEEIEKIGMHAYLSVAKGSKKEPKLIVMEYFNGDGPTISFVGKGLTYDSGGYSLKPSDGMKTMKSDMGGSAAVIGAIKVIASRKLKVNVVGVVAACENMLDGGAYKPGDVIGSLRGLTIEVDNTDAEGRLTLADAVTYSEQTYNPSVIIELSTLTGACVVAMGNHRSGILGNDQASIDYVLNCAKKENERSWPLPFGKEYSDLNKSDIADLKNSGGRFGGASLAGEFVGAFVEKTNFVHIDIAGPAYNTNPFMEQPKGGTGHMVKTLYRVAKDFK